MSAQSETPLLRIAVDFAQVATLRRDRLNELATIRDSSKSEAEQAYRVAVKGIREKHLDRIKHLTESIEEQNHRSREQHAKEMEKLQQELEHDKVMGLQEFEAAKRSFWADTQLRKQGLEDERSQLVQLFDQLRQISRDLESSMATCRAKLLQIGAHVESYSLAIAQPNQAQVSIVGIQQRASNLVIQSRQLSAQAERLNKWVLNILRSLIGLPKPKQTDIRDLFCAYRDFLQDSNTLLAVLSTAIDGISADISLADRALDAKHEQAANVVAEFVTEQEKKYKAKANYLESSFQHNLTELDRTRAQREVQIGSVTDAEIAEADRTRAAVQKDADKRHDRAVRELETAIRDEELGLQGQLLDEVTRLDHIARALTEPEWLTASLPQIPQQLSDVQIRLGEYTIVGVTRTLRVPWLVPLFGHGTIVIAANTDPESSSSAVNAIQNTIMRLLLGNATSLVLDVVDPLRLGASIGRLMMLQAMANRAVLGDVGCDEESIETKLESLARLVRSRTAQLLSSGEKDFDSYKAKTAVRQPYHLLLVMDYPNRCSSRAVDLLAELMANGTACGVCVVVVTKKTGDPAINTNSERTSPLQGKVNIMLAGSSAKPTENPAELGTPALDPAPPVPIIERAVAAIEKKFEEERTQIKLEFDAIAPKQEQYWNGDSAKVLQTPISLTDSGSAVLLQLSSSWQCHAVIGGMIGSGKTSLLHTIITGLCLRYSPKDLKLYLLDLKEGIGFKPYADAKLPHARAIALKSDREFAVSCMHEINDQFVERATLFKSVTASDITDYCAKTGTKLPRIVLVIDEFQKIFAGDVLSSRAVEYIDNLVREGRAYGIHVILASQNLSTVTLDQLPMATLRQIKLRIALKMEAADCRILLSDDNLEPTTLVREGEAIFNTDSGDPAGNRLIQVAYIRGKRLEELLREIGQMAEAENMRPYDLVVFDGDSQPEVSLSLLGMAPAIWTKSTAGSNDVRAIPVGEPISLAPTTLVPLTCQRSNNLLVIGDHSQLGGTVEVLVLSLLTAPRDDTKRASVYYVDFSSRTNRVKTLVDHVRQATSEHIVLSTPSQIGEMLSMLKELTIARRDQPQSWTAGDRICLVLDSVNQADSLHEVEHSFGEVERPSPRTDLKFLLSNGSEQGVHVVAISQNAGGVRILLNNDNTLLREFGYRIATQLGEDDSQDFFGDLIASQLLARQTGSYRGVRAVLYDYGESKCVRFRPYAVPSDRIVSSVIQRIRLDSSQAK